MILEAFSKVLRQEYRVNDSSAVDVLHNWLLNVLSKPVPQDNVDKIIHTEVSLHHDDEHIAFMPNSSSGEILLKSLYFYCESYEQWQFSRWLHHLKPHYFNQQMR